MTIQTSFKNMTERIAHQFTGHVTRQLHKLDLDAILGTIGLQVAKHPRKLMLPVLAAFGAGVAVGTLLAPMSGKELRGKVATLVGTLGKSRKHQPAIDGAPAESPYEQAARAREDQAAGHNGEKKGLRVDAPLPAPK